MDYSSGCILQEYISTPLETLEELTTVLLNYIRTTKEEDIKKSINEEKTHRSEAMKNYEKHIQVSKNVSTEF